MIPINYDKIYNSNVPPSLSDQYDNECVFLQTEKWNKNGFPFLQYHFTEAY